MTKLKGCINQDCISQQKKKKYKEKDSYCTDCGRKLVCLCKKCRAVLPDACEKALCDECAEKIREKNERRLMISGKVLLAGGSVAVVLVTAFPKLKNVSDIAGKLKAIRHKSC